MAAILEVQQVYTSYGLSQVLFGVSLEVAAGECVCLVGRNGVGKTTTMRSIMGLTPARQGHVMMKVAMAHTLPENQSARYWARMDSSSRKALAVPS